MQTITTNIEIPEVFSPLFESHRFKVSDGGRGGGRSWSYARVLLSLAMQRKLRILCAREYQSSIKDSVHRLLKDQIELLGYDYFYKVTDDSIVGRNDSNFIFKGLHHNATEIKSLEGVHICWVEEAEKTSEESWDFLIPTIRMPFSEIWISFNPFKESDPTYQKFIVNPPPNCVRMQAGFRQNPFFPDVLREEMEYDKKTNYEKYLWKWEGQPLGLSEAQVFKGKYVVDNFDTDSLFNFNQDRFYFGADWGFSQDPTTLVRMFIRDRCLYVDYEAWGIGVEIDEITQLFRYVPESDNWIIYADSARPETISYVQKHGFPNIQPVTKWKGSVEDGVSFMKSFEKIIVHPRCKHFIEELELYQYKKDRQTGEILPILIDKHNHLIDSARYALTTLIQGSKISILDVL